jgi:hypothetical protein
MTIPAGTTISFATGFDAAAASAATNLCLFISGSPLSARNCETPVAIGKTVTIVESLDKLPAESATVNFAV